MSLTNFAWYDLGTTGGLPLGLDSSFLAAVTDANIAPSKAWGLYAGDRSLAPVDGLLTIGGYDSAKVAGDFITFPLGNWTQQQPCPLQVNVRSIVYDLPNGTSIPLSSGNMPACIDPFQDRFSFPPAVVNKFTSITNHSSSFNGSLNYPTSNAPDGGLTITLDNNHTTVIPNSELVTLLRGSDQFGHYVITNTSLVQTEIAKSQPDNVQTTLGGIYLTFNYLLVDYESRQFQLAPAVAASSVPTTRAVKQICTPTAPAVNTSSPHSSYHSNHTGAIVGGTIGGVAGLVIVGMLAFLVRRHLQRRKARAQTREPDGRTGSQPFSIHSPTLSEKEAPSHPSSPLSPLEMPLVSQAYRLDLSRC